ncbi:MAG: shikimate dehydrogenase family protein [Anaeroplasmataceae bacterium]
MKKFALLGEHLSHSYSPIIQEKLFKMKSLDYSYSLLEIKESEIEDTLNKLKTNEYSGFNVTIPYKKKVMEYLDVISEEAKIIGSVNTIKYENGLLVGYNTDYFGFKEQLAFYNIDVCDKTCYVLGTGGASLAINKALIDLNAKVVKVSRNKLFDTITYDMLNISSNDIIVNTTPVGMYPNIDASPVDYNMAKKAEAIVDIIFNPSITKLMSYNKNSYNGLLMLIAQAKKAQDIWLGYEYNIDYNEMLKYVGKVISGE